MIKRITYGLGFLLACILLIISYYLQLVENIIPCPLCLMQRFCFVLLGILFLIGYCLAKKSILHLALQILSFLTACLGIFFSARNIWLQHYPSLEGECSANLLYMFHTFPFKEFIQKLLIGSSDCSLKGFEFLYLDMAEWALFWFVIFSIMCINLLRKQ